MAGRFVVRGRVIGHSAKEQWQADVEADLLSGAESSVAVGPVLVFGVDVALWARYCYGRQTWRPIRRRGQSRRRRWGRCWCSVLALRCGRSIVGGSLIIIRAR